MGDGYGWPALGFHYPLEMISCLIMAGNGIGLKIVESIGNDHIPHLRPDLASVDSIEAAKLT